MAFALLAEKMVFSQTQIFGGSFGARNVGRLDLPGVSFDGERAYFVLLAIMFALFGILVLWIRRGTFGRVLAAMRDSPVACATLGLSLTRTKLAVFMIAAAMAGVGGALFGGLKGSAGATDFLMLQSLPLLLLAVVGGITSVSGALMGGLAFALPALLYNISWVANYQYLWVGIAAISIGRNPNGIAFQISERVRKILGVLPRKAPPLDAEPVPVAEMEVTQVAPIGG